VRYVSRETQNNWFRSHPLPGDIILTLKGSQNGAVCLVPDPVDFVIAQDMVALRADDTVIDPLFLFAALRTSGVQEQIKNLDVSGIIPHFKKTDFDKLLLPFPERKIQEYIGKFYYLLSAKIELNRRTNETLEAMAKALFKSWFVDFDPVREKAAGRQPAGLDADTAKLFPSSFEDSSLGTIPKGWKVRRLSEITSKIGSGATPRGGSAVYLDEGVAFIRSQNVYDHMFAWEGLVRISDDAAVQLRGVTVQQNDILFNITGDSILRTCIVDPAALPARVSQHVAIIRTNNAMPPHFVHQYLVRLETKDYLSGLDAGATRKAVTKGHLESICLVIPPEHILKCFQRLANPCFSTVESNLNESRTLAMTRDTLLPKLLSGEVRV
jgi:type I restriction enzyme S subunit